MPRPTIPQIRKSSALAAKMHHDRAMEGNAIAAIWKYRDICFEADNGDPHRELDGIFYAIKGNWAIQKGLMHPGRNVFLDDIETDWASGCGCHLQHIFALRALPSAMITERGAAKMIESRKKVDAMLASTGETPTERAATPEKRPFWKFW
jgi:hypothetical protein